jgi:hypothetical protein
LVEISSDSLGATIVTSGTFILNSNAVANLFSPINPLYGNGATYEELGIGQVEVRITFEPNGNLTVTSIETSGGTVLESPLDSGNWGAPVTENAGANYWIRSVLNSEDLTGTGITSASPTTGWTQLTSNFRIAVSATTNSSVTCTKTANFTISIATDSSGNNIVASGTYGLTSTSAQRTGGGGGGGGGGGATWVYDPFTDSWILIPINDFFR